MQCRSHCNAKYPVGEGEYRSHRCGRLATGTRFQCQSVRLKKIKRRESYQYFDQKVILLVSHEIRVCLYARDSAHPVDDGQACDQDDHATPSAFRMRG